MTNISDGDGVEFHTVQGDDHVWSSSVAPSVEALTEMIQGGIANYFEKQEEKKEQDMTMHLTDHFSVEDIEIMKSMIKEARTSCFEVKNYYFTDDPEPETHTINDVRLCIKLAVREIMHEYRTALISSASSTQARGNVVDVVNTAIDGIIDDHLGC